MKANQYPLKNYVMFKDFDSVKEQFYFELTPEQQQYEIVQLKYTVINGKIVKLYIIASDSTMSEWNLEPLHK